MFPNMSLGTLNAAFVTNGSNMDLAVLNLVGNEVVGSAGFPCSLGQIVRTTGMDEATCKKYLDLNKGDYGKSFIELVINEVDLGSSESATRSRVNRGYNCKTQYVYDEGLPEFRELEDFYNTNPDFRLISKPFLKKLLVMFKGDLNKTVEMVGVIITAMYERQTFAGEWFTGEEMPKLSGPKEKLGSKVDVLKIPKAGQRLLQQTEAKGLQRIPNRGVQTSLSPVSKISHLHSIDLHMMGVSDAMQATTMALRDWWAQEQQERIEDGKLSHYGTKAQFVEPLRVVTGRGIHSAQGYSRIKVSVGKYLASHMYMYTEETWGYIILGKRKDSG
ncbi:hypothetical protein PSN45_004321 [Yamadazyma tenuis]|nr:hypothetical protein PSN45_004321 [Yamadazyma tenuis]